MSKEVDQMLSNLKAIKNGDDPRESKEEEAAVQQATSEPVPASSQQDDALAVAEKEVDRLYDEYPELADHLPRSNLHMGVARWDGRNGYCKYNTRFGGKRRFNKRVTQTKHRSGHHINVINEKIFEQGNVEDFLDTVRHEVAHAVVYEMHGSSQKHNHNWKALAAKLGADPSSCHSKRDRSDEYNYYIGCPNCGYKGGKTKRSKVIKQPFNRMCGRCGETGMVSFDAGDEMPDENGVVAVESIPWDNKDEWYDAGMP
ncbi:hypothetical protein M199_gp128 [Halogranum tailed virus 1]|uniref:SprT-like domain-containing protein n=1 Tax=Halogranum tailed virus 1 TaxID=1273749 RepID=R4TMW7_9CAUD|nr:hypothetical protein M199_gp128 [Halogranum tailed virus 1]AGM11538.1 hypothetical protein HGTV1_241 [Halogranum tailed virus 1]